MTSGCGFVSDVVGLQTVQVPEVRSDNHNMRWSHSGPRRPLHGTKEMEFRLLRAARNPVPFRVVCTPHVAIEFVQASVPERGGA